MLRKVVPRFWQAWRTYSNDSITPNLGQDIGFSDNVFSLRAPSLAAAIDFINSRTEYLRSLNVIEFSVIATSWIRRIINRDVIVDSIEKATGHVVDVIDQQREAELLISALPEILARTNSVDGLKEGQQILLVDQGGGSLEVAAMPWRGINDERPCIAPKLFEALGTVALRQNFFNFDRYGRKVDPNLNRTRILPQVSRIEERARDELLNNWGERRTFLRSERRMYAVGSAITNILPVRQHNVIHNQRISLATVLEQKEKLVARYEATSQQVLTVHKKLTGQKGKGVDGLARSSEDIDRDLILLYGLPVMAEVMNALEVPDLRVLGYPLRFGYYVWKYLKKEPISAVRADAAGPYVFVSYARADKNIVYDQLATFDGLGIRVWWDEGQGGLRPGKDYEPQLAKRIRGCSAMLWLLTNSSAQSTEVEKEIEIAMEHNRPVIPIEIQRTDLFLQSFRQKRYDKLHRIQHFRVGPADYYSLLRRSVPSSCFK